MKPRLLAMLVGLLAAMVGLSACSATTPPQPSSTASAASQTAWLTNYDLDGLDGKQVVEKLDAMAVAERPADLKASVRPDSVVLTTMEGDQATLPLPEGQFYVSIAPYVGKTHDCFNHSLATCLGELRNEEIEVSITDSTGKSLVNRTVRTLDNGFFGLWLPADTQGMLTIKRGDLSATAPISTDADQPTCITTVKLA